MRWLILVPIAAYAGLYFVYGPQFPDPMVTHFNLAGEADGFGSKAGFFGLGAGIMAFMILIFLGIPALVSKLPAGLVNIPNREYWLAPERRAETSRRLGSMMAGFGVFVLFYLDAVFWLAIQANLGKTGMPNLIWVLLGLMGVAVAVLIVKLVRAFRLPPGVSKAGG